MQPDKRKAVTRRKAALMLAAVAAGCSREPDLVGGEEGRIARVSDGDLVALDTGLRVRLVEIEAPAAGFRDRQGEPFADEARTLLNAAALGRQAKLHYGGLSRDRYDRALAHVIASDETGAAIWLNGMMARQGGARVRTFPDNARRARRLLAFEQEARTAKRGLWSLDHYRVRQCDDLAGAPNYTILEGEVLEVSEAAQAAAFLSPQGIRLALSPDLGKPDAGIDPEVGARLRLRGRIDTRGEPQIRLTHWAQVEVVE